MKENNKIGLFEEAPGVQSLTRYIVAIVVINVIITGWYLITRGNVTPVEAGLLGSEITIVTTLKIVQKHFETRNNSKSNEKD